MKKYTSYIYPVLILSVSILTVATVSSAYTYFDNEKTVNELFEGTFTYNFQEGECRYFEEDEEIPEGFEEVETSGIEVGEVCSTYDSFYELKLKWEDSNEINEELRSEGLSAIEDQDLVKIRQIEAKNKGYLAYIKHLYFKYSNPIILSVSTLLTAFAVDYSAKYVIKSKIKKLTDSTVESMKEDSNSNKQLLKELVEADENILTGDYLNAYLEYRELKSKMN